MPLRLGMPMSMTTTSGFRDFMRVTVSRPSLASPTTVRSGCCSTRRRRPPRMSLWSSARRMRIFLMVGVGSRRIGCVQRNLGFYGGAFAGCGIDCKCAAETAHAFFHAENTHAALASGIEAVAIVGDLQRDFIGILRDGDSRVFGGGVGGGVVERFLH